MFVCFGFWGGFYCVSWSSVFLVGWYNIDFCGFWVVCLLVVVLRFGYLDEFWFWVFRYDCGFCVYCWLTVFSGFGCFGWVALLY